MAFPLRPFDVATTDLWRRQKGTIILSIGRSEKKPQCYQNEKGPHPYPVTGVRMRPMPMVCGAVAAALRRRSRREGQGTYSTNASIAS